MIIPKTEKPKKLPIGYTLANPGNIFHIDKDGDGKPDPVDWIGAAKDQPHREIVAFSSPDWGLRAMVRLLGNYQKRHGINTIAGIINRYAPAGDKRNHTPEYIAFVASMTGIHPKLPLDLTESATMMRLCPAMVRFEQGFHPFRAWEYVRACEMADLVVYV